MSNIKKKIEKISAVIVTYNSSKFIQELILSLEKEAKLLDKIIIVENNSPDKNATKVVVNVLKSKYRNIEFILSSTNIGFGAACNMGSKYVKSKYILFINPDTQLTSKALSALYSHAINHDADIIGGKCTKDSNVVHRTAVRKPDLLVGLFEFSNVGKLIRTSAGTNRFYYGEIDFFNLNEDIEIDAVSGAYLLAKRKSFNRLNGFDEKFFMYLEDVDLGVRAKEKNMKVIYCPHSNISHVGGASSKNKYHIRHDAWYFSRKYYFKKHFGLITNVILQPLYIIEEAVLRYRERA